MISVSEPAKRKELVERFADKYFCQIKADFVKEDLGIRTPDDLMKECVAMFKKD